MKQISFGKLDSAMEMPHLLDIQTRAFEALLQLDAASHDREDVGLERVFKDLFPISDVHENFSLEFVRYSLGEPKYSVEECIERDMTYSAPLKATLQLVINEVVGEVRRPRNIIEKEVYLGELPLLTPLGTFVINGAERVIVSQLHRSPGVVFEESTHPNGQRLISARIIPFRGSWVEFTVDIHDVIYVHIDKKKKFPATALLRAFGPLGKAAVTLAVRFLGWKASVVFTDVPGPRETVYFCGVPLTGVMAWVPQSGRLSVGISVLSYAGQVQVGIAADAGGGA